MIDESLPNHELPIGDAGKPTTAGLWLVHEYAEGGAAITKTSLVRAHKSVSAIRAVTGKRFQAAKASPNEVADLLVAGGSIIDATDD